MVEKFDILIKGAKVADGTGNTHFEADVGISDGKVASIENKIRSGSAGKEISAENQIVCPGFIDTHSHDDLYVLVKPAGDDKIQQGVTTVVFGNCGISIAPKTKDHESEIKNLFGITGVKYLKKDDLNISSFGEYLEKLEIAGLGINAMSLVGHTTIRIAVMGMERRPPTKPEMTMMKELIADSMKSGAFGLSSGLVYAPGNYAETSEISELAKVVSEYSGIYTTHLRNEGDDIFTAMAEAFEIGKKADLPVHISHHKVSGKRNWGDSVETLRMISEARDNGIIVTCDQYPYRAGSTMLSASLPPSALAEGERLFDELLADPEYRKYLVKKIETGSEKGWANMISNTGFEGVFISIAPKHEAYVGKSIAEIAKNENRNPYDVFFDLLISDRNNTVMIQSVMGEDDIVRIMKSSFTMIGSDGIPGFGVEKVHPRMTGTFPRILGRYVREKGILSLDEAIRKMTSLPAQMFGLKRKGILKEGYDADLVIFDPETIIDLSTYDYPNQVPAGISYVFVNGQIAVENGHITGVESGTVLRHGINA